MFKHGQLILDTHCIMKVQNGLPISVPQYNDILLQFELRAIYGEEILSPRCFLQNIICYLSIEKIA